MQNSLFGKRSTFRGDSILHKSLETTSNKEITENIDSIQNSSNLDGESTVSVQRSHSQISSSIIAPSSSPSSEDVISRFTQKHGGTIKELPEEPILLVANKNTSHSVETQLERIKEKEVEKNKSKHS